MAFCLLNSTLAITSTREELLADIRKHPRRSNLILSIHLC
jgi:hypothetical protein